MAGVPPLRTDAQAAWRAITTPAPVDEPVWELFHENSKTNRLDSGLSHAQVAARMAELAESLPYDQYPRYELGPRAPLESSVEDILLARSSGQSMVPCRLALAKLSALLHMSYGVTRENVGTVFPRPFRVVPSAGALYPLELYFHTVEVDALPAGLYHYNASRGNLRLLREGDLSRQISMALVQPALASEAAMIVFVTSLFERSTFKYGDRGYRFALLEAGHVAQNLTLVAGALGLTSLPIGGFLDRRIDDLLDLDGLTHSTVYVVAIGAHGDGDAAQDRQGA
jgi:SagB-type dehydrogenase family enzyme